MPKTRRRGEPREPSPPFDRTEHLMTVLYLRYDVPEHPNLEDIPRPEKPKGGWPDKLRTKIDKADFLVSDIAWTALMGHLITDAEILADAEQVRQGLVKGPQQRLELRFNQTIGKLLYVLEHLPDKLDQAIQDLVLEAQRHMDLHVAAYSQQQEPSPSAARFAESVAARERVAILRRLKTTGKQPKPARGRRSDWTRETLHTAMNEIVDDLRKKTSTLTSHKLGQALQARHPEKHSPRSRSHAGIGRATAALVERFGLTPEFQALRAELEQAQKDADRKIPVT